MDANGNSEVPSVHMPLETPMPYSAEAMGLAGTTNPGCGDLCAAMITEIRKHQALYDPECKAYYDTHIKESLWLTIASRLDIDVETCRKKWRNLRDQFFKKRKRMKTASRRTAARIRMWRYMESMEFLVPYMAHRVTEKNQSHDDGGWQEAQDPSLSMEVAAATPENGGVSAEADGHSEMAMASRLPRRSKASARARLAAFSERADDALFPDGPPSTSGGGTLRRKRKCKNDDDDDDDEDRASTQDCIARRQRQQRSVLESDSSSRSHALVAKDEDEHFMLSCIPTLKKLSPYRKMELRCKIQQLLLEYTSHDDV